MALRLIYGESDITSGVGVSHASLLDSAGGQLDSVEVVFEDTRGLWGIWNPGQDDTIRLMMDGIDSGACYIDAVVQRRGRYAVQALSVPSGARETGSGSYERVTLLQLASDAARGLGFSVLPHGVKNHTYDRVDKMGETALKFLADRCALEGCALKVRDRRVIVYDEAALEQSPPVRKITPRDFWGEMEYRREARDVYARCVVSYGSVSGSFSAPGKTGRTLYVQDRYVTSIGEAQRFAKGLLRQANRMEHQIEGIIRLDAGLAGGCMAEASGFGAADGLYMVDEIEHRLTEELSRVRLRRKLEGY